jgi:hypothetical protein
MLLVKLSELFINRFQIYIDGQNEIHGRRHKDS